VFQDPLHGSETFNFLTTRISDAVEHVLSGIALVAWVEALTAIAAAYTKRMIPLRTVSMLNNVAGLIGGLLTGSVQTIVEHVVNLPLNFARMNEMRRLISKIRVANETDLNIEWIKPFMHPRTIKAGEKLFSKGDAADEAFLLVEGRLAIPERSVVLTAGALFGEMALFTMDGKRTASAVCLTDVRLLAITYEEFEQLYFQNPEFGIYLVRLIMRRFEMNHPEIRATGASETA
jgi:CRP/FNR family transcriptional regulator, cyclic AMP receptor protein